KIGAEVGRIQNAKSILAISDLEVWLVNAVNQKLVPSDTVRVKHVRDLVLRIELPVGNYEREIEVARGKRRWIGRIIHDVQSGKTHPDVSTRNIHAMIVVKLRLA